MTIALSCPHCGANYQLADRAAGQKVRCTKCQQVLSVPVPRKPAERPALVAEEATDITAEPVAVARPAARPSRAGSEEPLPHARKKTSKGNASGSILLLLLLAGGAVMLVLLVACGGAAAWLFWSDASTPPVVEPAPVVAPKDAAAVPRPVGGENPIVPDNPAKGIEALKPVIVQRPPGGQPPIGGQPPPPVGAQPPAIRLGPSKPPAPLVYQPHVPADKEEVRLSGAVADVAVGGGGRYLILRLAGKKKLAVFDVQQGKVAKELPLLEEVVHFTAGAHQLLVVYPNARLLHYWSLDKLERERSLALPDPLTSDSIHQICMGSASLGPLFVYHPREKRTLAMDPQSLAILEVRWTHWAPTNAYGPLNMRASPDGSMLVGWGGGWAGLDVALFNDGQQVGNHDKLPFSGGMFALPSADGQFLYTPWGIANRSFHLAKVPGLERDYLMPAVEPGYFLALRCTRDLPLYSGEVRLPPVSEVSVYTDDRKRLFSLRDCEELKADSNLHWEKCIHYYPKAGLLATLGGDSDRIILRHIDLVAELDRSGADYLVVLSRPPLAQAGKPFDYRLDIRSKKGGVKVKLETGPDGLKVTPEGRVSWSVSPRFSEPEAEVLVTISDASGQEIGHSFTITVGPR
jgi:predicted Zn finger-like uncharacterized protein